jgi:hypothetical protein
MLYAPQAHPGSTAWKNTGLSERAIKAIRNGRSRPHPVNRSALLVIAAAQADGWLPLQRLLRKHDGPPSGSWIHLS